MEAKINQASPQNCNFEAQKCQNEVQNKCQYYVSPEREMIEYLHFVYAILDDTDLLTKVSRMDVECMASLLNRLKSLMLKKEVEIVNFDDIKEDADFTEKAAQRLLQNEDFIKLH